MGSFVGAKKVDLHYPPTFLEGSGASVIYAALDKADPELSFDSLLQLSVQVRWLVLFLGSDLAGSNGRSKHEIARKCAMHNQMARLTGHGIILLILGAPRIAYPHHLRFVIVIPSSWSLVMFVLVVVVVVVVVIIVASLVGEGGRRARGWPNLRS